MVRPVVSLLISLASLTALMLTIPSPSSAHGITDPAQGESTKGDALVVQEPDWKEQVTGTAVPVVLRLGKKLDLDSLEVTLNGVDVSDAFVLGACTNEGCEANASLTLSRGLVEGWNKLVAVAYERVARPRQSCNPRDEKKQTGCWVERASDKVAFQFDELLDDTPPAPYVPSAIGLNVTPGGALPWVEIDTGTPASLQDSSDPATYSLPYPSTTLPGNIGVPCQNVPYQVAVLERKNPTVGVYACYADSASLKTFLQSLAPTNIVIVGTVENFNAPSGLDTTPIGGSDFSQVPTDYYPQGYLVIGVPTAPAGTAYESYYVATDTAPLQTDPFAQGVLAADVDGNYSFYPSDARQFELLPNDPSQQNGAIFVSQVWAGGSGPATLGFSPPFTPNNDYDGFWLLVLDRNTFLPIDSNDNTNCWYNASGLCGQFFQTGSSDPTVAAQAVVDLTAALDGTDWRKLVVLAAMGQPFQSGASVTEPLANAIVALGGSRYTLQKLTYDGATFSLMSRGAATFSGAQSPFARGIVWSSNVFSAQGQTGILRGVVERDPQGLYLPTLASQDDGQGNGANATSLSIDFRFSQIAAFYPLDWPLTDTAGHIAAYHYVSQQYLSSNFGETGSHLQDLRWFYAGEPTKVSLYHAQLNDSTNANCLATQQPPANAAFTQQDLCDARAQLYQELLALYNADQYLGDTGLGGLLKGTVGDSGSIAGNVIGEVSTLLDKQLLASKTVASSATFNAKVSEWLNFASAVVAIGATTFDPAALPELAAGIGGLSGGLKLGSTFNVFDSSGAPLSYENGFDVELGAFEANATTYQQNLIDSYETALDAIYSDWGKLQAIGALTQDSDSGWIFTDQLQSSAVSSVLEAGIRRALYLQGLPQFYELDAYPSAPVSEVSKVGTLSYDAITEGWSCIGVYPTSMLAAASGAYPPIGSSGTDLFVLGGAIDKQNLPGVTESLPSNGLIQLLFGAPASITDDELNLPGDPFFSTNAALGGFLSYRPGPSEGNGPCWIPGCSQKAAPQDCTGP